MSSSKRLDIDALLHIASLDTDEAVETSDVEVFIEKMGLAEGNYQVYNWQIYYHYKKWSVNPLTQKSFSKILNKFFKSKKKSIYNRHYGVYFYSLNKKLEVPYEVKKKHKRKDTEKWRELKRKENQRNKKRYRKRVELRKQTE